MPHLFNLQRSPNIHRIEANLLNGKKPFKLAGNFSGSAPNITLYALNFSYTKLLSFSLSLPCTCCEHYLECHLPLLSCTPGTLSHHSQTSGHSHNPRDKLVAASP